MFTEPAGSPASTSTPPLDAVPLDVPLVVPEPAEPEPDPVAVPLPLVAPLAATPVEAPLVVVAPLVTLPLLDPDGALPPLDPVPAFPALAPVPPVDVLPLSAPELGALPLFFSEHAAIERRMKGRSVIDFIVVFPRFAAQLRATLDHGGDMGK